MSVSFPTNTVVMIIATMLAASAVPWYILSQGLRRLPVATHLARAWR